MLCDLGEQEIEDKLERRSAPLQQNAFAVVSFTFVAAVAVAHVIH